MPTKTGCLTQLNATATVLMLILNVALESVVVLEGNLNTSIGWAQVLDLLVFTPVNLVLLIVALLLLRKSANRSKIAWQVWVNVVSLVIFPGTINLFRVITEPLFGA